MTIKDASGASPPALARPSPCLYPPADSPSCSARPKTQAGAAEMSQPDVRRNAMAQIVLNRVDKTFAHGVQAVHDLSLEIPDGEFMVLVGPSGCGKSTALRIIAGLEDITHGTLQIGDRVVNNLPPKDRDIAMIFQNYALYPQMTVAQNMAFGLQMRKTPKDEIARRVKNAASILGLEPYLARKPG